MSIKITKKLAARVAVMDITVPSLGTVGSVQCIYYKSRV